MDYIISFYNYIKQFFNRHLFLQKKKNAIHKNDSLNTRPIEEIVNIYIESSRFLGLVNSMLAGMDESKQRRYIGRVTWYKEQLDISMQKLGLTIICSPDTEYDAGMPVQIQNIGDFDIEDILIIEKWIEPTIVSQDGNILNQGIAIARRK